MIKSIDDCYERLVLDLAAAIIDALVCFAARYGHHSRPCHASLIKMFWL